MIRRDKTSVACRKAIPLLDRAWSEAYWLTLESTWTDPVFGTEGRSEYVVSGLLDTIDGTTAQVLTLPIPPSVRQALQHVLEACWDEPESSRTPWDIWTDRRAIYKHAADIADRYLTTTVKIH